MFVVKITCDICQKKFQINVEQLQDGKPIYCPHCGEPVSKLATQPPYVDKRYTT